MQKHSLSFPVVYASCCCMQNLNPKLWSWSTTTRNTKGRQIVTACGTWTDLCRHSFPVVHISRPFSFLSHDNHSRLLFPMFHSSSGDRTLRASRFRATGTAVVHHLHGHKRRSADRHPLDERRTPASGSPPEPHDGRQQSPQVRCQLIIRSSAS